MGQLLLTKHWQCIQGFAGIDSSSRVYYLQSRYYDPVMKRMICVDNEAITAESTLKDNNIFTYCDNNPVNNKDEEGDVWQLALAGGTFWR